jgi:hypothetical protein
LVKAAAKIQAMGPKVVIKGEHGALLFMIFRFLCKLCLGGFDPTGAGDTLRVVLQDSLHK